MHIEVLSTVGTRGYEQFFTDVGMEWIDLGEVPKWRKQWELLNQPKLSLIIFAASVPKIWKLHEGSPAA